MSEMALGKYSHNDLYINIANNTNRFASYEQPVKRILKEGKLAKNGVLGRWLKRNWIDLRDLPVSYTIFNSITEHDTTSYVLDELETQTNQLVGPYRLNTADVNRIAQHYSHPALAYTYGDWLGLE